MIGRESGDNSSISLSFMDAFIARKISAQNFLVGCFLERFCDSIYTGKHEEISISRVMRYFGR